MFTAADHLLARAVGIRLDDYERVQALEAELRIMVRMYLNLDDAYNRRGKWLIAAAVVAAVGWAVAIWGRG